MKDKIQTLKIYLKEPLKAISDKYSLLVALQEILHIREHDPANIQYDKDIYELFHATFSLFLQPIEGKHVSKWDELHPPLKGNTVEDELIISFEGFDGQIKKSHELWADFQSYLHRNKATIESQIREGVKRTALQKICDSYILISFPFQHTVTYNNYINGHFINSRVSLTQSEESPVGIKATQNDFDEFFLAQYGSLKPVGILTVEQIKSLFNICNGYAFEEVASIAIFAKGLTCRDVFKQVLKTRKKSFIYILLTFWRNIFGCEVDIDDRIVFAESLRGSGITRRGIIQKTKSNPEDLDSDPQRDFYKKLEDLLGAPESAPE